MHCDHSFPQPVAPVDLRATDVALQREHLAALLRLGDPPSANADERLAVLRIGGVLHCTAH
jgi:hypothetical protein